jgi:RNA polymerase sigma factor (sigma-70 family)
MTPLLAYRLRRDFDGSFESVYKNHVRDVYGFALSILGNPEEAEDVTQTTFLNAYRALKRGEDVRNLRAWLFAIAHNVCRQRFRTNARRPQQVELDPDVAEAYVDEDAPTAEEIRKAMSHLNFNQRTVLVLREIEGLAYEEIAHAMDLSLSAVETLLFRARQALREQLEAAENDLGCDAVQRLISLQLDGKLSRQDRGLLRAHLRTCSECAHVARSQRARKRVMPGLLVAPLPASLTGTFGGGGGFGLGLVGTKAAAVAISAAVIGAGALVETKVVSTDGEIERRSPVVSAAPLPSVDAQEAALLGSVLSEQPRRLDDRVTRRAVTKLVKAKKKPAPAAEAQAGQGTDGGEVQAASTSPASGGSSGSSSSSGSSTDASPPASTSGGVVDAVVGGAQSNLPPPPVSPPIEVPSLPPVQLPGTGSLP